jgi:hypothetical protein
MGKYEKNHKDQMVTMVFPFFFSFFFEYHKDRMVAVVFFFAQ